jgi:hypothetical protein
MDINVKNTYDLFFHPFEEKGPTKKGFGRLAASVAIFIGTVGIYHLVVGSMQKWRVSHPGEGGNVSGVFQNVHGAQPASPAEAFFARHPQVIRPSMWKEWAEEAGIEIQTVTDEEAYKALAKGRDVEAMLKTPCKIFGEGKTVEQTRMHVYIPPGLSFNELNKILDKRYSPQDNLDDSLWRCDPRARSVIKDKRTEEGWVEMTRDLIPDSTLKVYDELEQMVRDMCSEDEHFEVPKTLEAAACLLAWNFNTGERFKKLTICQEKNPSGDTLLVGNFFSDGLRVACGHTADWSVGVMAMRKLS